MKKQRKTKRQEKIRRTAKEKKQKTKRKSKKSMQKQQPEGSKTRREKTKKNKTRRKKQRGKQKCFPRLCKTESGLINIHRMQHIRPPLDAERETAGNDDVVAFVCRAACKRHGFGHIFKTVETPES